MDVRFVPKAEPHSITSSARASNDEGIVRPRGCAVLRLGPPGFGWAFRCQFRKTPGTPHGRPIFGLAAIRQFRDAGHIPKLRIKLPLQVSSPGWRFTGVDQDCSIYLGDRWGE